MAGMQVAAILERRSVAPLVVVAIAAWAVLAVTPMAHESSTFLLGWAAMCAAMMLPTVLGAGAYAASGSTRRATAFAIGYLAAWLCTAPLAYVFLHEVRWSPLLVLCAAIVVGAYQFTPIMRRALAKCHERRRCARPVVFGAKQGVACIVACLPLMVLTMVMLSWLHLNLLATLVALLVVTALMSWQKLRPGASVALGVAVIALASVAFVQVNPGGDVSHLNEHQVSAPR